MIPISSFNTLESIDPMQKPAPQSHIIHGKTVTGIQMGQGPDLVILHSLLTDGRAFDQVLPALAKDNRVTLLNLPGFHGSTPIEATWSAYSQWIADAVAAFGVASGFQLLGNGFGGSLALGYALAHPTTLSKLVICDAAAGFPEQGKQAFRVMAEKVAAGGLGAIAEIAANRVFHPAYLEAHPNAINERREALLLIHPDAFQAACSLLVEADLIPQCKSLDVPVLVICGELDAATPPVLNRAIADAVPHARYIELPQIGHCPPLEAPDAFLAAFHSH
jgi:3-oxoadipate enol-lactonase